MWPQVNRLGLVGLVMMASVGSAAPLDIAALQTLVTNGQAAAALAPLAAAVERDPDDARLLYDHGVAAYAAGAYEEALVSLDRAEALGNRKVARKARFQKGNAEYQLGQSVRRTNLEETIARWRESIRQFAAVVRETDDPEPKANFEFVRRELMAVLLADAKRNREEANRKDTPLSQKLEKLRNAFERYTSAKETDPESAEAQAGEQETRDELADALMKEGTRKSQTSRLVPPRPNEAPIPRPDFKEIEEGVAMLEDAAQLKPKDPDIQEALTEGKERMADARTFNARILMAQEQQMPWPKEKLAVLRMAKESVEKALDKVPDHKPAKETLEAVNRRLAQVMEEQADQLAEQADQQSLEQQTQMLGQSLDFYQQAGELQPQQKQLQQKAEQTQDRLEEALAKLADRLMQQPRNESMEQQAARLEGAEQALSQLEGLEPSPETAGKLQQVSEQLDGVRQKLAEQGKPMGQPGGQQPQLAQTPQGPMGPPMDAPPRVNTPGAKGTWQSPVMNRAQDY
ncbi:MAG TPA: hypothetical protein DCE44_06450 [Verrucomicrobiales bacterium]|nr:hypothetical protein [Verrucomicrobiales bacterium]